ncbi:MAG TPA: hypothetical protein DEO49_06165, partial [Sutterella sp.]|nr:hypothetical protein [Sutterella sp.]
MNRVNLSQALNGARGSISLKSLEWFVKAQDLFVTCCAKQHYRNDGSDTLEIVYSFPLSWKSVVTGFAAVIDGTRYVARTLKKSEAEEKYERHIAKGDKPMLLEVDSTLGICTANLGNIKPGEEITLEISWAKMAVWDEGAVRITIPSVIADRYDRTGGQGGLLPHQRVESNFLAQYPCSVRFELSGILADGSVCVPQHPARVSREEACTVIEVTGAFADRDITLEVTDLKQTPPSLLGKDGETWVGYPVFTPVASEESSGRRLCVKTLVDCSGSMSGLSITQAKSAIAALPSMLKPEDKVTLSLFGSSVVHRITTARACTAKFLRQDWLPEIERG